jgi:hypothetical protein
MPIVHWSGHGEPLDCQVPVASHFCGCEPLHWSVPGVQLPVHTPFVQR